MIPKAAHFDRTGEYPREIFNKGESTAVMATKGWKRVCPKL
jgi:hypothetical protein